MAAAAPPARPTRPPAGVEDRRYGLPRIDRLRPVPARVRCFKPWGAWGPDSGRRDQQADGRRLAGQRWDERPESSGALL